GPPMRVAAVRLYRRVPEGLKTAAEVWAAQLEKELRRVFPIPKDYDAEEAWSKVDAAAIDEVRVITYTQPSLVTGVPKKKPDLMENRVGGGSIEDRSKYARGLLGKEIPVTEFCREGSMVDVAAITKGKGWQGHHTRWGTRLLSHKNSKHRRNIGTLGNFQPGYVRPTVPQGGQFGYHQRTEYNKRILKIGEKGDDVTPDGGFLHYGNIRNPYVLLHGSIPGPTAAKAPKAKGKGEEAPRLAAGSVHVYSLDGNVVKTVELPGVFRSDIRVDLIRRAVTAFQANRRQPYGPGPQSGMRHSVRWS